MLGGGNSMKVLSLKRNCIATPDALQRKFFRKEGKGLSLC